MFLQSSGNAKKLVPIYASTLISLKPVLKAHLTPVLVANKLANHKKYYFSSPYKVLDFQV
jgi:hypothetical protein